MAESVAMLFLYFPYFLLAIFLVFYIPGSLLLKKLRLVPFHHITLSLILGMAMWGLQGFLFGFLQLRFLSYVYLLLFFFLWITPYLKKQKAIRFTLPNVKAADPIISLTIILGVAIHISILVLMGIRLSEGLYFCCGAIGDFIYHLRLTQALLERVPPFEPDMYGVYVSNYHYAGNLLVADLVRVFRLPLVWTQFQYMGTLLSLLFGLSAVVFSQLHKFPKNATRWLIFFLYFGGDFIYIIILIVRKIFILSMGPLENGAAFLNNPPRAFAVVGFFGGLALFSLFRKRKDFYTGVLMAIAFGIVIGFKVYIGIFAMVGLLAVSFYDVIKRRWSMLLPSILAIAISLLIYLPVNKGSGGLFYVGFWRFEEFIVQKALGLSHLELAREIFATDHKWLPVLYYDLIFMALFTFAIFGPKLFGIFQTKKSLALLPRETHIFLITGIIASTIAGYFFWQRSGGSNSFNFLVSVYIIGSIYTAIACYYWISKMPRNIKIALVVVIALLNMPRIAYEEYKNIGYIVRKDGLLVTNQDLEAMQYVRKNTPKGSMLFIYDAAYQTFIGQRGVFLGAAGLLGSHDVDTSERKKIKQEIIAFANKERIKKLFHDNHIDYVYLSSSELSISTRSGNLLKNIFQNEAAKVYKVL